MDQKDKFTYFSGSESDAYIFVKVPKQILTDEGFRDLSAWAKLLYGLLLDRMSLSAKNGWIDEENRVYICYPIAEIMKDLNCSRSTAVKSMKELDTDGGIGLVEKRRRGQGSSNVLYVKKFYQETEEMVQKSKNQTSEEKEAVSEVHNAEFKKSKIQTSKSPENRLQEVQIMDSNKTYINNTNSSNTDSNQIISPGAGSVLAMRCDVDEIAAYSEIIKENIEFDSLLQRYPYEQEMVQGIFDLILETVLTQGDKVLISSNTYPTQLVKSKFLKLNYSHIEYVMGCMSKNTTKVQNIKKYLLASLFNAPSTIDGYFKAEVNHDFPQYAAAR